MASSRNSRPLLDTNSDSEDVYDDNMERAEQRDDAYFDAIHNESSVREIESATDDFDDDTQNLFRANNTIPSDRLSFTYIVFYLLGTTTLLPWNFFITAEDYWMYKFRNTTSNSTVITPIQATFTSDLSFSASIPNTIFLILNAFYGHKIRLHIRMIGSLVIILLFFLYNTTLIKVNTDTWQDEFFYITIGSVIVMNVGAAILSGGLFGVSGQFPSEYVTAVVSGQALGGVFTAVLDIITITFATDPRNSAFTFFMIGNGLLVLSLIAYVIVIRTAHFKHYTSDKPAASKATQIQTHRAEPVFRDVLNKMWLYGFTEWMVFVVTLCIYPSVTVLVSSEGRGNGHPWNDIYFVPVTNYLIFNSGDYLGRILAGMLEWPSNKPHVVAILSILRMAFVPALLLCNTIPRHRLPVVVTSDYIFILLMCCFAFTNGYLANIAMIMAPKSVTNREREMASSAMAAFLGIGLAFGSTLSLIIVQLL